MDVDWLEFYGLKGDPFSAGPLRFPAQFRDIFVTTPLVQNKVNPIVRTIEESDRYLYLILGERGVGKSTLLWYIYNKLDERENILPIHVSLTPKTYETKHQEHSLAIDLANRVTSKTLERIREKYNELYIDSTYQLDKLDNKLTEKSLNFDQLRKTAPKIFKALDENDKIPVIIVDNLDKFKDDLALDFLSYHYGQALFEDIFQPYTKFFIAAELKWSRKFDKKNTHILETPLLSSLLII
ncbi:MAG: ATP-binding protein [Euryarchaeota archaeon]|nr:ATP-binding protein [Euryarchaeota archaeon]